MSQFAEQFPIVFNALNVGFLQTFKLFIFTLVGSIPLGLLMSFGSMSKFKPLRIFIKVLVCSRVKQAQVNQSSLTP